MDNLCKIGYNFEVEYSTHGLELLEEIVEYEDLKITHKEWCDRGKLRRNEQDRRKCML